MTTLNELEALAKATDKFDANIFCQFYAAANPTTILTLIALVRQQHEALKWCADDEPDKTVRQALAAFENFGVEK